MNNRKRSNMEEKKFVTIVCPRCGFTKELIGDIACIGHRMYTCPKCKEKKRIADMQKTEIGDKFVVSSVSTAHESAISRFASGQSELPLPTVDDYSRIPTPESNRMGPTRIRGTENSTHNVVEDVPFVPKSPEKDILHKKEEKLNALPPTGFNPKDPSLFHSPATLLDLTTNRKYKLRIGRQVVGRKDPDRVADVQIVTMDEYMSRHHVSITVKQTENDRYLHFVKNQKNKNETLLNDRELPNDTEWKMEAGQILRLADTKFEILDE